MDHKTYKRLKRDGRFHKVKMKPRNGFDAADDWGLLIICIAILLIIGENQGWLP